jgi:hypothetical protein
MSMESHGAAGRSRVDAGAPGVSTAGLADEGVGSSLSMTDKWDACDGFPELEWQKGPEAEPDRLRVRYIPQTRWNNAC